MTKKSKAVKGWALKDKDGKIWCLRFSHGEIKELYKSYNYTDEIIRVLITEVPNGTK